MISVPQYFFNSILEQRFFLFFQSLIEKEERCHWILAVERNILLTPIQATKKIDVCVRWFYLARRVYIKVFFTFKVHEKNRSELDLILFFKLISVFEMIFQAMDKFITVSKRFWVKNGLKISFLGQNYSLDFKF